MLMCSALCVTEHPAYTVTQIEQWEYCDETILPFILTLAAWAANDTQYSIDFVHPTDDLTIFRAYNDNCLFAIQFNKITRECSVYYETYDDHDESYDYRKFKRMIDFFFVTNQKKWLSITKNYRLLSRL